MLYDIDTAMSDLEHGRATKPDFSDGSKSERREFWNVAQSMLEKMIVLVTTTSGVLKRIHETDGRTAAQARRGTDLSAQPAADPPQNAAENREEQPKILYEGVYGRRILLAFKTGKLNDGLAVIVPVNRPSTAWARVQAKKEMAREGADDKYKSRSSYYHRVMKLEEDNYVRNEEDLWEDILAAWRAHRPWWYRLVPLWRVTAVEETNVRH